MYFFLSLFLSQRTPLARCCVHNMSPFISSSGLLQAVTRPKFSGPRSASIAWSQVWLRLPNGQKGAGVLHIVLTAPPHFIIIIIIVGFVSTYKDDQQTLQC